MASTSPPDPFTRVNLRIFDALMAWAPFSSMVKPGNRLSSVKRDDAQPLNKAQMTGAAPSDRPGLLVSQAGYTLQPFGSNSKTCNCVQAYLVQLSTLSIDATIENRMKWEGFRALFNAGDDLGLSGLVAGWTVTPATEGTATAQPGPTPTEGWASQFNVNVELYWQRATLLQA